MHGDTHRSVFCSILESDATEPIAVCRRLTVPSVVKLDENGLSESAQPSSDPLMTLWFQDLAVLLYGTAWDYIGAGLAKKRLPMFYTGSRRQKKMKLSKSKPGGTNNRIHQSEVNVEEEVIDKSVLDKSVHRLRMH